MHVLVIGSGDDGSIFCMLVMVLSLTGLTNPGDKTLDAEAGCMTLALFTESRGHAEANDDDGVTDIAVGVALFCCCCCNFLRLVSLSLRCARM